MIPVLFPFKGAYFCIGILLSLYFPQGIAGSTAEICENRFRKEIIFLIELSEIFILVASVLFC